MFAISAKRAKVAEGKRSALDNEPDLKPASPPQISDELYKPRGKNVKHSKENKALNRCVDEAMRFLKPERNFKSTIDCRA